VTARMVLVLLLGLAVMFSAFGVVLAKHENRQKYKSLVMLQNKRDMLEVEWGRLQLEQSSWATHARIEKEARNRLKMSIPEFGDSVMVTP